MDVVESKRTFKLYKDPHKIGCEMYKRTEIELCEGLTVLVGCNGTGKTTLLRAIKSQLEKENVPVIMFDNLHDGGQGGVSSAMFNDNIPMMATLMTSSEGESIGLNIGTWSTGIRYFIANGEYRSGRKLEGLVDVFASLGEGGEERLKAKKMALQMHSERWILLDAVDSGYSVDNVIELKGLFKLIQKDANASGKHVFIVVSANEYELARKEKCFDVHNGSYIEFSDYEDYRNFIIDSRKIKDNRYIHDDEKGWDK